MPLNIFGHDLSYCNVWRSGVTQKGAGHQKNEDITILVADMFETMHGANGIGLAAPQIGKAIRLFVVDGSPIDDDPDMVTFKKVFVNPR